MTSKNRKTGRRASGKKAKKTKRPTGRGKAKQPTPKQAMQRKTPAPAIIVSQAPTVQIAPAKEGSGFKITLERIDPRTIIGDLIVVFPTTREVLRKHGLRLDVEHAGDIYMTLEAFAALLGLKTGNLIEELKEASKEPPPPIFPGTSQSQCNASDGPDSSTGSHRCQRSCSGSFLQKKRNGPGKLSRCNRVGPKPAGWKSRSPSRRSKSQT